MKLLAASWILQAHIRQAQNSSMELIQQVFMATTHGDDDDDVRHY